MHSTYLLCATVLYHYHHHGTIIPCGTAPTQVACCPTSLIMLLRPRMRDHDDSDDDTETTPLRGGMRKVAGELAADPMVVMGSIIAIILLVLFIFPPDFIGDHVYRFSAWVVVALLVGVVTRYRYMNDQAAFSTKKVCFYMTLGVLSLFVLSMMSSGHISGWCCMSDYHLDTLCDTMTTALRSLEREGIPYWLCYGTLMVAVRDPDLKYQTLPWEHDMDICIYAHDYERVMSTIAATPGVQFITRPSLKQTLVVPDPYPLRFKLGRGYVDLRLWEADPQDNSQLIAVHRDADGTVHNFEEDGRSTRETIEPFSKVRVCNQEFSAPGNQLQAIRDLFGTSWKDVYMFPGNIQGTFCRLHTDCTLPDRINPV